MSEYAEKLESHVAEVIFQVAKIVAEDDGEERARIFRSFNYFIERLWEGAMSNAVYRSGRENWDSDALDKAYSKGLDDGYEDAKKEFGLHDE